MFSCTQGKILQLLGLLATRIVKNSYFATKLFRRFSPSVIGKLGNRFIVRGFLFIIRTHTLLHAFCFAFTYQKLNQHSFSFLKNSKYVANNLIVELPKYRDIWEARCLMVSEPRPATLRCVLGQDKGKTLYSHGASLHPGVQMGQRIKCWGVTLRWTSIPSRGE